MLGLAPRGDCPLGDVKVSGVTDVEASVAASEAVTALVAADIKESATASFNEIPDTDLAQVGVVFATLTVNFYSDLADSLQAGDALTGDYSADIHASAQAFEAVNRQTDGVADVRQTALAQDATLLGYVADLTSAAAIASDSAEAILVSPAFFSEQPNVTEALNSQLIPGNQNTEAIGTTENWFSVVLRAATTGDVFVTAESAEVLADDLTQTELLSFSGNLADTRTANAIYRTLLIEGGRASGISSPNQVLYNTIRGRGHATTTLLLDPRYFEAWVINTDTGAVSRYLNMPFNSAAWFDRRSELLLAKEDGIYVLDPDMPDDEGLAIEARIRTGLTDFGSSRLKRVHSVNLGLTAQGTLVAKAVVTEGGQKDEHWYQIEVNNRAPGEAVVPLGQGLTPRYWGVEVANQAGADFEIDTIELYPVGLPKRKVS